MLNLAKLPVRKSNVALRVSKGHFATNHSHINYLIDVTFQKSRLSEAQAVAKALVKQYVTSTIVDTIVCLDGMQVVGACLAEELTKAGFMSINAHQTIYVITPELSSESQLLFRENLQPMLAGKHVLILMASVTTGLTISEHGMSATMAARWWASRPSTAPQMWRQTAPASMRCFTCGICRTMPSYHAQDCPFVPAGD